MKLSSALTAAAFTLAVASPAVAAGDIVSARDPQTVLDALTELGYPGKLDKMEGGRTTIAVTMSGLKTFIDFYDCAKDFTDCYTLLFSVSLDLKDGTTLEKANDWNSNQVTGRVWLDRSRDPTLDYSVSTFDGMPTATFTETVKLWNQKLADVTKFFDF